MKKNCNTAIVSRDLVLVPYKEEHVPIYHEWMKSPFLQEMTASEPLSLQEEFEMQQSWYHDKDKCTFILLSPSSTQNRIGTSNNFGGMIGDINLFLNDTDDNTYGELELMIAEESFRGKGLGTLAVALFMEYVIKELRIKTFGVKISLDNVSSIGLFKRKFAFEEVSVSKVFNEVTMKVDVNDALMTRLETLLKDVKRGVERFESNLDYYGLSDDDTNMTST